MTFIETPAYLPQPTLEEVEAVFEGFVPIPIALHGEHTRGRKQPFYKPGQVVEQDSPRINGIIDPTHNVRTSYTPEQLPYIHTVATYLNALINGKSFTETAKKSLY